MSISNEQHDALISLIKARHEADVARLSTRIELDKENIAKLGERLEAAEKDAARFEFLVSSGYGWIDLWRDKYKVEKLRDIIDLAMKESK